MHKLGNYIASAVIGSVTMMLIIVVSLVSVSMLIEELDRLVHDYTFNEALIYVALQIPSQIYEFTPFAALVGCLVGVGSLASTSELTVMRAAGVSVSKISWLVMRPVLLFIGLSLFLGEYVTPYTEQMAESRKAMARGVATAATSQAGLWNREGNEYMYINAVQPNGKLFGIARYLFDDQGQLKRSSFGEVALFQGDHWLEENVQESRLDYDKITGDPTISQHSFVQRRWNSELTPKILNVLVLPPESLSIQNLFRYANYLDKQEVNASRYWLAFWQKTLQPLVTASLVIIAISFIFGPLRDVSVGFRIFSGVIVGIVFSTSQKLLGPSSLVFGFPPLLAVATPLILCFGYGLHLLRKAN